MFRPFQRLDDVPPTTGVGLGLAVAKGFTEAMGGTLTAEQTPGGGLTMVIRLPLSTGVPAHRTTVRRRRSAPVPLLRRHTTPSALQPRKQPMTAVLVVDDDPHLLKP